MTETPETRISRILDELALEIQAPDLTGVGILAAVSGGADSVVLLCILNRLVSRYGFVLSAVTVNHRIRSEKESAGDARFVQDLCASFNSPVVCHVVNLLPGEVAREAASRKGGIEEAARSLRYRHFDEIADKTGISYIMTGHTKTDQVETILMRFFQGTGGAALGGIARRRGRYARPLLDTPREDIIAWLCTEGQPWREDATNADAVYLRNKIRLQLVPVLDSILPGWEGGVLNAGRKALLDDDFCRRELSLKWKRSEGRVECSLSDFQQQHPALAFRFLQDGLILLSVDHRVPFGLLKRMMECRESRICGSGLCFAKEGDSIFLGPDIVQNSKSGYLVNILSCGTFGFPFGTITVSGEKDAVYLDDRCGPFCLPLTVRSRMAGDTVRTSDGKQKTVKKLLNDWSIHEADRNLLPLIEQSGIVRAVFGSALGYPDWYVQI